MLWYRLGDKTFKHFSYYQLLKDKNYWIMRGMWRKIYDTSAILRNWNIKHVLKSLYRKCRIRTSPRVCLFFQTYEWCEVKTCWNIVW